MSMVKHRNSAEWGTVVVTVLSIFSVANAQLFSSVETDGKKVYTFYPQSGTPLRFNSPQQQQPRKVQNLQEPISIYTSAAASPSLLDANSIATLFRDDPAPPQTHEYSEEEQIMTHRSSPTSNMVMSGPQYAYSYSPQPTTTFGSMIAPFQSHLQGQYPQQTSSATPSGSLSSWYLANGGSESAVGSNFHRTEPMTSASSEAVPSFTSSITSLLDTATHHLQQQYPTPLQAFAASLLHGGGAGVSHSHVHHDSAISPSEFGGGWSEPHPPPTTIHHPPTSVVHLPPTYHNHDPFGPPPVQVKVFSPPRPPPIVQYVKDSVANFPWNPYGNNHHLKFFSTVGKTLDSTLGGAWAARRALKKGVGTVLSSKVRLGGTLAYVGSEVVAKAIDVVASV